MELSIPRSGLSHFAMQRALPAEHGTGPFAEPTPLWKIPLSLLIITTTTTTIIIIIIIVFRHHQDLLWLPCMQPVPRSASQHKLKITKKKHKIRKNIKSL